MVDFPVDKVSVVFCRGGAGLFEVDSIIVGWLLAGIESDALAFEDIGSNVSTKTPGEIIQPRQFVKRRPGILFFYLGT